MKPTLVSIQKTCYLLVRTGLGLIFIWASWDKLLNPADFAVIVDNYDILPRGAVNAVALILPWVECLCGLLLLCGRLVPGAVLTVDLLLIVFLLAAGLNYFRGLDVNCGCFSMSPDAGRNAAISFVRNFGLLAAGLWLFWIEAGRPAQNQKLPPNGVLRNAG